jgi:hypothetical protein
MGCKKGDECGPVKRKSNFLQKNFYSFQTRKAENEKVVRGGDSKKRMEKKE